MTTDVPSPPEGAHVTLRIWLAGARGSVAVTSIVGAAAVAEGLTDAWLCDRVAPVHRGGPRPVRPAGPRWARRGGHPLDRRAEDLARTGVLPSGLLPTLGEQLQLADKEIRPAPSAGTQADVVAAMAADLAGPDPVLPPNSRYAWAAFRAGCPYVNFTPSPGVGLPALHEVATDGGVPYAGNDGKTGETLPKSVLAPMFAVRNLPVRSWSGLNLLGGGDGATAPTGARTPTATPTHRSCTTSSPPASGRSRASRTGARAPASAPRSGSRGPPGTSWSVTPRT
jgi:myo-inositol-1-phosphate synthase